MRPQQGDVKAVSHTGEDCIRVGEPRGFGLRGLVCRLSSTGQFISERKHPGLCAPPCGGLAARRLCLPQKKVKAKKKKVKASVCDVNYDPTPKIQSLASALAASSCGSRAFADTIQGKWAGGGGGLIHGCVSSGEGGGPDTGEGRWPEGRGSQAGRVHGGTWGVPPEGPGHPLG